MRDHFLSCWAWVWLVSFLTVGVAGAGEPLVLVLGERQLFLDDRVVERTERLQRRLHAPEKRGAVLRPDVLSDGNRVQTYGTVPMWEEEEQIYKLIYMAFPRDGGGIGAALAISKDGVQWEKPDLGQGINVGGSTRNNRIFVDRSLQWGDNALWNVIRDPDDSDPNRRYKGLLGAIGREGVFSRDGVQWVRSPGAKIPSGDTSTLIHDRTRKRYVAFVKGQNQFGRAANVSISEDFEHWSDPRPAFGTDELDQKQAVEVIRKRLHDRRLSLPLFVDPDPALGFLPPEKAQPTWRAECYAFACFPYEGLFVGLPMLYYPTGQELPQRNNTDGFHEIQLTVSRDLEHWERVGERQVFLGPSRVDQGLIGVFDRQELIPPSRPVSVGDELWFYYTGFKSRIPPYSRNPDGTPRDPATLSDEERADLADGWSAICLAVLRRDGFVSWDGGADEGWLLTRPFRFDGKELWVNLAADDGAARVEILDEAGEGLAGYSGEQAGVVRGDGVRQLVQFPAARDLNELAGRAIRLKIHLRKGSLYAFWVE